MSKNLSRSRFTMFHEIPIRCISLLLASSELGPRYQTLEDSVLQAFNISSMCSSRAFGYW